MITARNSAATWVWKSAERDLEAPPNSFSRSEPIQARPRRLDEWEKGLAQVSVLLILAHNRW